jgi:GTP-binding protein Era
MTDEQPGTQAGEQDIQRCGYVALVGRPNVGKSTLLNHILEQKISITSRKPQTTRHRILGIKTENGTQAIYVDTPGIHADQPKAINRQMNRTAAAVLQDVDVIVLLIDKLRWTPEDELVLTHLQHVRSPVILAINKVDQMEDKQALLPFIEEVAARYPFKEIVPVSALKGSNLDVLQRQIEALLPEGHYFFPDDQITDRSMRFIASEMIREKIMRQLGQELPYAVAVEIEQFSQVDGTVHIDAAILVERAGQKGIVIGKGGERLKKIGSEARKDMELGFDAKVMLNLWVKVRSGWSDDERALQSLGYTDQ